MHHSARRRAVAWSRSRRLSLAGLSPLLWLALVIGVSIYGQSQDERAQHGVLVSESFDDLLSCSDVPSTPAEPLAWCSDGSSPQCLPAAPPHASPDLWHGQPAAVGWLSVSVTTRSVLTLPEHPALPQHAPRTREPSPLERPPRRV
jgi:hypothetical protein